MSANPEDAQFDLLAKRFEVMQSARAPWHQHWQDIRYLVNPDATDFNRSGYQGDRRTEFIFDGTAPWALEQLASGLHSFLTSPNDRWFNLNVENYDFMSDDQALLWLESVADILYTEYSKSVANLNDSLHEGYQELGSFGTAVIHQYYNLKKDCLTFRAYPLAHCYCSENSDGMVDTLYRESMMSTRQIEQEFPKHTAEKIKKEKNQDKEWTVVHAVFPRSDRNMMKYNQKNKKFASFYFCKEAKAILSESGFDMFPYHVPRWLKRAGEVYGRSPAMNCLPDIKLVNAMEKVGLKAVQKIVDPPLLVPNEGFMLPISTVPGGLIYYEAGLGDNQMIKPLETKGRVDIGEEKLKQKRDHIMRCFYADWIEREKKKERQTTTEIMDDRSEMLQLMAPILGRLQTELLGPMLALSYSLMQANNRIPLSPSSLQRKKLKIEYVSPAARAQYASKAASIRNFTQELIPLAQISPEIMDNIDPDAYAQEMAKIQDVSRKILRPAKDVAAIRQQRNQMQQAQQLAQAAQPAAQAVKDLATARASGGMGAMPGMEASGAV